MTMDEQKAKIIELVSGLNVGVISTVTEDGQPQGAVVEFAMTDDLEIVFNTFTTYRKYENLRKNPKTSFTIGWEHDVTVQYEGLSRELSGDEEKKYKEIFAQKYRNASKWDAFPETRYFAVKPTWIRYNDLNKQTKEAFVLHF